MTTTKTEPLPRHAISACWPDLTGDEWDRLCGSIRENGLLVPIWTWHGEIIDGWQRQRACLKEGITPRYQEWDGKGPLSEFVVALNLDRRQQSPEEIYETIERLRPILEDEAAARRRKGTSVSGDTIPEKTREKLAKATKTSPATVARITKVLDQGTKELIESMKSGQTKPATAARFADLSAEEQVKAINESNAKARKSMKKSAKREQKEAFAAADKFFGKGCRKLEPYSHIAEVADIIERVELAMGMLLEV